MRVFIAIPIPGKCLEFLSQIQDQLKECAADVRWTRIDSIHLTLKFLGEIDPGTLPVLTESLYSVVHPFKSLNLRLTGWGSFPNWKNPRIIWYGIEGDLDALCSLQGSVETVCGKIGFPPEDRPFKPHLTLGRVKSRKNLVLLTDRMEIGSRGECLFNASHFNIYKSILKPQGAVYTVLETIALE